MPSSRPVWPPNAESECHRWQFPSRIAVVLCLATGQARAQTAPSLDAQSGPRGSSPSGALESPTRRATLLLIRTNGDTGVMTRLRAELEQTTYNLVEIRLDERHGRVSLDEVAAEQRATAAVRFDASTGQIELWVSRPGGAVTEEISRRGARLSDWVLVLRTTEALRAHGLDLGPEPKRPRNVPEPPDARARTRAEPASEPPSDETGPPRSPQAPRREPSLGVGFGMGADLSPGGLPLQSHLHASVYMRPNATWMVQAFGWYPIARSVVSGVEGKAEVRTWLVGSSADAVLLEQSNARLAFGPGFAVGVHSMQGEAAPGYRSVDDRVVTSAPFVRADLRLRLTPSLEIDLATLMGFSFPELTVEFSGRDVAHWGRPFVALGLGLESAVVDL